MPAAPAAPRLLAALLVSPLWGGLAAALATALWFFPPVPFFLLPLAAARLARAAFSLRPLLLRFLLAALTIPAALVLSLFFLPGSAWIAGVAATAFVALPSLAVVAGARDGRRRDDLALLVSAAAGIGALSVLLGF